MPVRDNLEAAGSQVPTVGCEGSDPIGVVETDKISSAVGVTVRSQAWHMAIDKGVAAATRMHRGGQYT